MESSRALALDTHVHGVQANLFDFESARWPRKPYCTDSFESGIYPRTLVHASRKKYIQANPPQLRVWSIYDIDYNDSGMAWEQCMLPEPSWTSMSRDTGRVHLAYGLSVPVLINGQNMRNKPLRYLAAVESAFTSRLNADTAYSGFITKNPASSHWRTFLGRKSYYDLFELAEYVELPKHIPKIDCSKLNQIGICRNIAIFEWLRFWAYRHIKEYKALGLVGFKEWQRACENRAFERNGEFHNPLIAKEVLCIANSVSKWTWTKFDFEASDKRFRERQAHRGTIGGLRSGEARSLLNETKRSAAKGMYASGKTIREIATELSVGKSTVGDWLSGEAIIR